MVQMLARFIVDDQGQDLIEYAFLAIFIALAVVVGLQAVADGINSGMSNIGSEVGGS
jgi:Flp pilus assembly pilin Flp